MFGAIDGCGVAVRDFSLVSLGQGITTASGADGGNYFTQITFFACADEPVEAYELSVEYPESTPRAPLAHPRVTPRVPREYPSRTL